jgi:hypothetical protein
MQRPPHEKDNTNTLVEKTKSSRANVTKTAGQVERNHNRTIAGRYNTSKKDTNTRSGQVDDA